MPLFLRAELTPEMARILATPVEVLKTYNFDDQTPGEHPRHWGERGDANNPYTLYTVANTTCISAPNALLIDTSAIGDREGGGYRTASMPHSISNGVAVFSFAFRLDEGNVTTEIRAQGKSWIPCVAGLQDILRVSGGYSNANGEATGLKLNRYTWYRLTIWLPTVGRNSHRWAVRLDTQTPEGSWAEGEPIECYGKDYEISGPFNGFNFVCGKAKIFVDDVTFGVIHVEDDEPKE